MALNQPESEGGLRCHKSLATMPSLLSHLIGLRRAVDLYRDTEIKVAGYGLRARTYRIF